VISVGFTLQPEVAFLELCDELIRHDVDYYEVAPETLWRGDDEGRLEPNGFHRRFLALRAETDCFFVAHGVGLSMGTACTTDAPRRRAWLAQLRRDQRDFHFRWYTDHLGATSLDGQAMTLPLPLPMNAQAASVVRRRLASMQRVVPHVGVENNVAYFLLGDPLEEPGFLKACVRAPKTHLLLDLHNLYTMACNFDFDPADYLARLDLSRVIEIHLSGGVPSDPAWLPSGRVLRLDSHDTAVPEPVWSLFAQVLPRCRRLRGVTLERMEGTVAAADVPILRDELARMRRMIEAHT
jgi:uncharacterized protein (UPF0276 family)